MIRITVERAGTAITIREFADVQEAGLWWIGGANISDSDVVKIVWEKFDESGCDHRWAYGSSAGILWVGCKLCRKMINFSQEEITEFAKIKGRL